MNIEATIIPGIPILLTMSRTTFWISQILHNDKLHPWRKESGMSWKLLEGKSIEHRFMNHVMRDLDKPPSFMDFLLFSGYLKQVTR